MKDYGSELYKTLAIVLGLLAFFGAVMVLGISGDIFFTFLYGSVFGGTVYIIYLWFSKVLNALEENGNHLKKIEEYLNPEETNEKK
jgi:predicted PurR-regulated permease PerM